MDTRKHQKNTAKFNCELCYFKCSRHAEFMRHLSTAKHLSQSQGYNEDTEKHQKNTDEKFPCESCGKRYKFHSGLWRHKKNCNQIVYLAKEEPTDKELIMMLVKQNTELLDVIKNGTHITNNTTNNNNQNSHNKTFNLQFFLNETCKDAMNITDFVDAIKIQLSDLIKVGEIGYVEGISNIITNNLKAMDITQRPIHCTDKKREVLYVKDEDKWEKENEEKQKVRKVIKSVVNKNIQLLPKFAEEYPECKEYNSPVSDQYNQLIIESLGSDDLDKEAKIISNISSQVVIDK